VSEERLSIAVDLSIYPLEIVLRACHAFTRHCYVSPRRAENGQVTIDFTPREGALPRELAGEVANALLDAQLRRLIADETRVIRELLVAQAFCEADLLDRRDSEGDEYADPRGIAS
jgi:His-Xaa-Ser system protein HxsD